MSTHKHKTRTKIFTVFCTVVRCIMCCSTKPHDEGFILVDDGASYSGTVVIELNELSLVIMRGWDGIVDDIPDAIQDTPYWQY